MSEESVMFTLVTAIIVAIASAWIYDSHKRSEQFKACIAAGWEPERCGKP